MFPCLCRQDWDNHVARNAKIAEENDDQYMHEKVMQEESLKDNEAAAMAWRIRQNIIQVSRRQGW